MSGEGALRYYGIKTPSILMTVIKKSHEDEKEEGAHGRSWRGQSVGSKGYSTQCMTFSKILLN